MNIANTPSGAGAQSAAWERGECLVINYDPPGETRRKKRRMIKDNISQCYAKPYTEQIPSRVVSDPYNSAMR